MRRGRLALALATLAGGCSGAGGRAGGDDGTGAAAEPIAPGQAAPAFTLKGLDGQDVPLASFRGKAVLLSFWGVGCGFCREEVPALKRFQERYGPKGFTVLAVNVYNEPNMTVQAFVKEKGINYPVLLSGRSVGLKYGIPGTPSSFYLDPEGRVASSKFGREEESEMEAAVKAILPKAPAAGG